MQNRALILSRREKEKKRLKEKGLMHERKKNTAELIIKYNICKGETIASKRVIQRKI